MTNCPKFDDYLYISMSFNLKLCIHTVLTILLLSHVWHYAKHALVLSWMYVYSYVFTIPISMLLTLYKLQNNELLSYDYCGLIEYSIS